jgi:site-specific recombinase XerD
MTSNAQNNRQPSAKPTADGSQRERVGDHATIFRLRSSPFWYIDYSIGGVQFRRSLRTSSKRRAIRLAKTKDAELTLGVAQTPSQRPALIVDVTDQYIKSLALRGRRPGTLADYARDLAQFAAYARSQGIVRLQDANERLLEDFQQRLKSEGMRGIVAQPKSGRRIGRNAPKTIRTKLKSVRQLIKWALKRRLLLQDPAAGFQLPPEPHRDAFCWSTEEFTRLCNYAEKPWQDILRFLALTGLRSDELAWLTVADISLSGRPYVRIRRKTCPQTGVAWQPKHGRERIVPLCPAAAAICRTALAASPGPWLFWSTTARGKQRGHFQTQAIWGALQKIKVRAGITRGSVHTTRHLFCAFAANHGISPFKVMKILGHGSLDIVLTYYHLADTELLSSLDGVPFDELAAGCETSDNLAKS